MQINYTIKDQAYEILKKAIVSGQYAMGEQLKEIQIAEQLGISRSPVRTAFTRLVNDGLLEEKSNRGVFVHKATPKHVEDIIQVRIILEREAIGAAKKGNVVNIERLENLKKEFTTHFQLENHQEYADTDYALHQEIISYCDNQLIVEFYYRIYSIIQMYRNIALKSKSRFQHSFNEHILIINALIAGEFDQAWEYNRKHLFETEIEVKNAVLEMG